MHTKDSTTHPGEPRRHGLSRFTEPLIANSEQALYFSVAILLMLGAVLFLIYSIFSFLDAASEDFGLGILTLINDLLLVLIMLEVLSTVRTYLATGTTTLRVFLYVGIISAIRRILAIGAQTTLGEGVTDETFRQLMIDLAVNSGVVLVLALALYLVGLVQAQRPTGSSPPGSQPAGSHPDSEDDTAPVRP